MVSPYVGDIAELFKYPTYTYCHRIANERTRMYFLTPMCFSCLHLKNDLCFNPEIVTKLLYCLDKSEEFITPTDRIKICKECLDKLNLAYYFKKTCLSNICQFKDYIGQLEQASNNYSVFNIIKVELNDVLKVKDELKDLDAGQWSNEEVVKRELLDDVYPLRYEDESKEQKPLFKEEIEQNEFNAELINFNKEEVQFNELSQEHFEQPSDRQFETVFFREKEHILDEISPHNCTNSENQEQHKNLGVPKEVILDACQKAQNTQPNTDSNKQSFSCTHCDKCFTDEATFKTHMLSHTYFCSTCKKYFVSYSTMQGHNLGHSGDIYSCSICEKYFKTELSFNEHKRSHGDQRPYVCPICNNTFKQKQHLKRHMSRHNDQRPHSCSICGSNFKEKNTLTRHMLSHSDERLHSCSTCGKRFNRKDYFNRHMLLHDNNKQSYMCAKCGKGFTKIESLRKHMFVKGHRQIETVSIK